jgi:hypothetical protein
MDATALMVELWFESEPQLDDDALLVAHPRFQHTYTDGVRAPIVTAVLPSTRNGDRPDCSQTWDWQEASSVLERCSHSLMLVEWTGRRQTVRERIEAFVPTVRAAVELSAPAAAWCPNSERVVAPRELLEDELAPLVNVRMFRDGETTVMDTLGLHALALPDAQCRFNGEHEPPVIAAMLYDLAAYLLDRGDVIEDGDTLGELPWLCRDGPALVAPGRRVLDLVSAA